MIYYKIISAITVTIPSTAASITSNLSELEDNKLLLPNGEVVDMKSDKELSRWMANFNVIALGMNTGKPTTTQCELTATTKKLLIQMIAEKFYTTIPDPQMFPLISKSGAEELLTQDPTRVIWRTYKGKKWVSYYNQMENPSHSVVQKNTKNGETTYLVVLALKKTCCSAVKQNVSVPSSFADGDRTEIYTDLRKRVLTQLDPSNDTPSNRDSVTSDTHPYHTYEMHVDVVAGSASESPENAGSVITMQTRPTTESSARSANTALFINLAGESPTETPQQTALIAELKKNMPNSMQDHQDQKNTTTSETAFAVSRPSPTEAQTPPASGTNAPLLLAESPETSSSSDTTDSSSSEEDRLVGSQQSENYKAAKNQLSPAAQSLLATTNKTLFILLDANTTTSYVVQKSSDSTKISKLVTKNGKKLYRFPGETEQEATDLETIEAEVSYAVMSLPVARALNLAAFPLITTNEHVIPLVEPTTTDEFIGDGEAFIFRTYDCDTEKDSVFITYKVRRWVHSTSGKDNALKLCSTITTEEVTATDSGVVRSEVELRAAIYRKYETVACAKPLEDNTRSVLVTQEVVATQQRTYRQKYNKEGIPTILTPDNIDYNLLLALLESDCFTFESSATTGTPATTNQKLELERADAKRIAEKLIAQHIDKFVIPFYDPQKKHSRAYWYDSTVIQAGKTAACLMTFKMPTNPDDGALITQDSFNTSFTPHKKLSFLALKVVTVDQDQTLIFVEGEKSYSRVNCEENGGSASAPSIVTLTTKNTGGAAANTTVYL